MNEKFLELIKALPADISSPRPENTFEEANRTLDLMRTYREGRGDRKWAARITVIYGLISAAQFCLSLYECLTDESEGVVKAAALLVFGTFTAAVGVRLRKQCIRDYSRAMSAAEELEKEYGPGILEKGNYEKLKETLAPFKKS